ncbi:TRAP transporter permease [Nesterenkonia lacusekhoensis]|uniref:TRAP transporter 4TM/12TM fusion protein n=1 Tax=Nesterenkonia lacusekhoensis TaxID=150832 RepID=A0ABS4T6A7_9MICC|nr:TRAP transporter 4TM/12TM fusion protein [Nesterenkonia lacusekhoensis]
MTDQAAERSRARSAQGGATPGAAAEEQTEEVLREHDISSRFRTELGWWGWLVGALAVAFTAYHLFAAFYRPYNTWMHGSLHVAGALGLIFLLYPASRRLLRPAAADSSRWINLLIGRHHGVAWYDAVLAAAAIYCSTYIFGNYGYLVSNRVQMLGYEDWDILVAAVGVLLVLEATRRCVGLPIVIIAGLAILYAVYGNGLPVFSHRGQDWEELVTNTFLSSGAGIFGTPIQVSANFIFLFLFFAVVLLRTHIGQFFNDLAFRAAGRFTGGPAKAAVAASGLQGMISGSSVANTVASGSFTIPIMKKAGFKPHIAAATEATASTGGQMMPPIMGAAAFIMAQNIGDLEYNELIVIAIIPAGLYFLGAMLSVHFEAKRNGLKGMAPEELPSWRSLLVRMDMLLPLVVIITTLLSGMSAMRAALFGIGTALAISLLRAISEHFIPVIAEGVRQGRSPWVETGKLLLALAHAVVNMFIAGARTALPVIAACASAGIVAGTVTSTGLGGQLGAGLMNLAGGNFLLLLFFVMIACIVLGMGLPTTANYVVTATIAAPILYNNFDVPLIAAHMFVFFFGILADITPPVCLAAYAGAGIAHANPMAAGVAALKIAFAGFLIPYAFILEPALLLQGTVTELLLALGTVILGLISLASGLAGYLLTRANWVQRALLLGAGFLLIYPDPMVSGAGLVMLIAAVTLQLLTRGRSGTTAEPAAAAA